MKSREAEEHFDRGIHYFRGGFFPAALQEFRIVRKLEPDYPNINFILEAAQKKNDEVVGQISSFIEETFDAEIRALSETLNIEGSSTITATVENLLRKDRPTQALDALLKAASYVPESKPLLLLTANLQRRIGKIQDAERTLLKARALFPDDSQILNNLGNIYLTRNFFKAAADQFEQALSLSPNDFRILNNLGSLKMQTYKLDEAKGIFEKLVKVNPKWIVARRNLESVKHRIAELDNEIERFRSELTLHPTYLDINLSLGKALLFRGFTNESRSVLEGILKKKPNIVAAYFYLGIIFELEEQIEKAIDNFKEMVVRKAKTASPEFKAFESLHKEGYLEEALIELKKLAVLDLDLAAGRINLGIKYFEDGLWEEALGKFEEAVAINSTYPDSFYWMALSKIQLGKKTSAEKNLRSALALNPNFADAHYQLGMLILKKSPSKAKQHLQTAVNLGLKSSFAANARRVLIG